MVKQNILVADDSLTIQKVIKITLSNEPFELEECHEDKTLMTQVKASSPDIVLLDFNLSENKTGYDLAKEIKKVIPKVKILMLYGTFDSVDENLLSSSGCDYHIAKPFDGNKFIQLCRSMTSDSNLENDTIDTVDDFPEVIDEADEWVVNQPEIEEEEEHFPSIIKEISKNTLENSLDDWSIEIPGVINEPEAPSIGEVPELIAIPATIEEVLSASIDIAEPVEVAVPNSNDLSFPDEDDLGYPDETDEKNGPKLEPISHLVSLDELAPVDELVIESTNPDIKISMGTETIEEINDLKNQIQDEIDDDDLWEVDSFEDSSSDEFELLDHKKLDEINNENVVNINPMMDAPSDFPEDVMSEKEESTVTDTKKRLPVEGLVTKELEGKLVDLLFEKFKPLITQKVEEFCKQSIDKVSWDVIPDLAENMIQKELASITRKVMGEDEE